jgi:hypothetical protein
MSISRQPARKNMSGDGNRANIDNFRNMLNRDQAPDAYAAKTYNVHDQENDIILKGIRKLTSYGSKQQRSSQNPFQAGPKNKRDFYRKTKTGCMTCKRRKKKCDKARPHYKLPPYSQQFIGLTKLEVTNASAVDFFANGIITYI